MKILMLGWELPPHNSGGLGVACYQLCRALALKGVSIDFMVPYKNKHKAIDFMHVIPALPYTAQELGEIGGAYNSQWYTMQTAYEGEETPDLRAQQMHYTKAALTIAQKSDYDAIHAHDWLTFEAAIATKKLLKKPLIAHVHATEFDRAGNQRGNPIVHDIEYTAMLMADRIIAVSQATKDIIVREYAIPSKKIEVLHNSIDTSTMPALSSHNDYQYLQLMKAQGYKVVVSLSRLTVQKGLTYLLHAAQSVVQQNPKVLFLIAGAGEQYHELIALSAELGIAENVLFTSGFVRGKKWRDTYAIADMFVLPSVSEPFGITPLEAIGYGSAVLISKQSGVGEVLHNVLKFDYWDTTRLANQILAVAEYEALQKELYRNSLAEFNKLSWHDVADKCNEIYSRTVKEPKLSGALA